MIVILLDGMDQITNKIDVISIIMSSCIHTVYNLYVPLCFIDCWSLFKYTKSKMMIKQRKKKKKKKTSAISLSLFFFEITSINGSAVCVCEKRHSITFRIPIQCCYGSRAAYIVYVYVKACSTRHKSIN